MMYYLFDWDDGTTSTWIKQQETGTGVASHSWMFRGTYEVRVKAKDIYGRESDWSEPLSVTIPKNFFCNEILPSFGGAIQKFWELFKIYFFRFPNRLFF